MVPPLLFSPYRLPARDYAALFEPTVASFACRSMVLRARPNGLDTIRVGVIGMKKVFHHAVERSRARRLMREAFRLERPQLKVGYDLVLLARRGLLEGGCAEARRDLLYMCRKLHLLTKPPAHS